MIVAVAAAASTLRVVSRSQAATGSYAWQNVPLRPPCGPSPLFFDGDSPRGVLDCAPVLASTQPPSPCARQARAALMDEFHYSLLPPRRRREALVIEFYQLA